MSARNPLAVVKGSVFSALNKAYYVKKLRATNEIVDFIWNEMTTMISPLMLQQTVKAWIRDMITSRLEQTELGERPDLFRDLDYQFAFREGKELQQCALGDLDLDKITKLRRRKEANRTAAERELNRFNRAASFIEPLLYANSGWVWRDAVLYLEKNGGIPDIDFVKGV